MVALVYDGNPDQDTPNLFGDASAVLIPGPGGNFTDLIVRLGETPPTSPPPSIPPPGGTTPLPPGGVPITDVDRFANLLDRLFGQSVAVPRAGAPTIIPQPVQSSSILPIGLVAIGVGIMGWIFYKQYKGGS